jgi:ubiquinone/menaquinone biosynthesis C-methylase UbiE
MAIMTTPSWDSAYTTAGPPPCDTGRPQPVFARLAAKGLLTGELLDCGCGTGEQTLLALAYGADALGIDVSPQAISQARAKAAERGVPARFQVADAFDLAARGRTSDTVQATAPTVHR